MPGNTTLPNTKAERQPRPTFIILFNIKNARYVYLFYSEIIYLGFILLYGRRRQQGERGGEGYLYFVGEKKRSQGIIRFINI